MHTAGEPFSDQGNDARVHTGQRFRKLHVIETPKQAALGDGFIAPGDAKQIEGVQVPKSDFFQTLLDVVRDQSGVFLLSQGGDDDFFLANSL